jgi:enoyl-CoA hydratase/carnithine racemase
VSELLFETRGPIAILTINRPAQRNALNHAVREGLREAFARFEADPVLRVAILTAEGDRAFCAGMDLKEAAQRQLGVPPRDFIPILGDSVKLAKPVIAAVNGMALAGGFLLAQMCDLCVASTHATFAITEVKVGRGMPWAVPLAHMIPQKVMLELLLTGQPITARRAYEIGLVNHVVDANELMPKALELAGHIAAGAPLTVAAAREMVHVASETGRSEALDRAYAIFRRVYESEDALEGPRAFAEKRAPQWKGR